MWKFSPEKLVKGRKRKGKTQVRLSEETGISQVTISAIENGRKEPRAGTLVKLADALECNMDYFFST